jgi:hypothetical protein
MLFLISLFFTTALSVDISTLEPHLFSQVLSDTSPADAQAALDAVNALIAVGEAERGVAEHNLSVATGIWSEANNHWQNAYDAEQTALGEQTAAEEAEADATQARDDAISYRDEMNEDHVNKAAAVPGAKANMESEIARVDEEKATLEDVIDILNGILSPKDIQVGRKLLSRTTTLLSNPVFLAALAKADPGAVQQVIDKVNELIQAGEDDRNFAIGNWRTKVAEAEAALQALIAAEAELSKRENELVDATAVRVEKTGIAEGKTAVEVEKRSVRDAKQEKMDIQAEFTNREIARIETEKVIYEKALHLLDILKKIIVLLQ